MFRGVRGVWIDAHTMYIRQSVRYEDVCARMRWLCIHHNSITLKRKHYFSESEEDVFTRTLNRRRELRAWHDFNKTGVLSTIKLTEDHGKYPKQFIDLCRYDRKLNMDFILMVYKPVYVSRSSITYIILIYHYPQLLLFAIYFSSSTLINTSFLASRKRNFVRLLFCRQYFTIRNYFVETS